LVAKKGLNQRIIMDGVVNIGCKSDARKNKLWRVAWKCATYRANTHGLGAFTGAEIMV